MTAYYNQSIEKMANKLGNLKSWLPEMFDECVQANSEAIVGYVRKQLYAGKDGDNQSIANYRPYKHTTKLNMIRQGRRIDIVRLYFTGNFYKNMIVETDDEGFRVTSFTRYTNYLVSMYGDKIFKLTNLNLSFIIRKFKKNLRDMVRAYLDNESEAYAYLRSLDTDGLV